jgi:serine/threonine protein kinase
VSSPVDRHRRLRAVFDEALLVDEAGRPAYLDEACAGDPDLHAQVIRLLALHQSDSFLEDPAALASSPRDEVEFTGTDRFRVLRKLGAGGMGVVYEVHDGLRDEVVALKTLRRSGAADLYRLKREFRSLADVTHPNLVCLYELFVEEDRSFFTMERVRGAGFVDYVRGADNEHCAIERLVPAFRQLVDGVAALHQRGKLHRDIKPSNVLVTPEGRVVILDFGLIEEARSQREQGSGGGTPAYMSPEEAAGGACSEASDWYAVGVTMYEALTGSLPFTGSVTDVLRDKRSSDPRPASEVTPGVPLEMSAVCAALLHRSAAHRLTGPAALRALLRDTPSVPESGAMPDALFIGRAPQLHALNEARDAVANGVAHTVAVHGPSGMGKSALVSRFLQQFVDRHDVVVLTGRCYENESVPYKALDGVVDDLSRYLTSLSPQRVAAILPPDVSALPRVFPVLLQVDALSRAARTTSSDALDPIHVRRRAFDSLAVLLTRLAAERLLVIWIDDLQWADADSTVLLEELLDAAPAPAMLTVLSFRSEEVAAKSFLRSLLDRDGRRGWSALSLEPMTEAEAEALIGSLLPGDAVLTDDDRQRMTREALGSPFVLEQLALSRGVSFHARFAALSPQARLFLEALAICGRPMAPEIVCDACDITSDRQALVVRLRVSRFIRSSGSSDRVETYHDRIREALANRLVPDALRDVHRRLVSSLVARHSDDCEALFEHYRGAGEMEQASVQAGLAAEKASAALAFDRAASFYRHALDLAPSTDRVTRWREALAAALANAARPAEAADEYLRAAEGATHARRVELQGRAAEQFLTGGHIDQGLDLIRSVLASVGVSFASSPRMAAIRLVWRRLRLGWRGLGFVPRTAREIDADTLLRLDTCWAAATGLGLVDVINACDFFAQHLHMALDAGEPSRIARGIALESSARSANWAFRKGARRLAELSTTLAQRVGTPQALATDLVADSVSATAAGQWKRARSSSEQALKILQDQCVGVTWEINIAQNVLIWALMYLGEYGDVSRRVPALLADARRRGNLYLATEICTRSNIVWLIADQPDEGERETMEGMARWSQKGFHRQHYSARLARVQTALYRGDAPAAWRLLVEREADLHQSMLLHVQAFRIEALYLRARCAISMAYGIPSERRVLRIARSSARRIARERMAWSNPLGLLIEAGIASVEERHADAERMLQDAGDRFERAEMGLYAAVTRRRLGALRGDAHGQRLQEDAEAWMARQSVRNPVALTRMLAPGFPDAPVRLPFPVAPNEPARVASRDHPTS